MNESERRCDPQVLRKNIEFVSTSEEFNWGWFMGQKIFQWRASVDCLAIVLLLSLMFLFSSIPKSALNFKEILETSYTKKPKRGMKW